MARNLGNRLPDALAESLRTGAPFASGDKVVLLLTVDPAGWPHAAAIAAVAAPEPDRLRVPCHAGTSTLANLERTRQLTVVISDRDTLLYIKARCERVEARDDVGPGLRVAECRIEAVLDDNEPAVPIRTGITFSGNERTAQHVQRLLSALAGAPV